MVSNVYFDLTRAFNASGPAVALASGQAVVYYRVAIMSKDGDWVIRETAVACAQVLGVLASHRARYRPGAPLDVRWLAGGWSSHFEFTDAAGRRVRCDFFSRPPRIGGGAIARLFAPSTDAFRVVDLESLIRMKRTQRAKDYAVISELAARLPPDQEILLTTDPDRLMILVQTCGHDVARPSVRAAATGDRDAVVVALAREQDQQQRADRARLAAYAHVAEPYLDAFARLSVDERQLPDAHRLVQVLADRWLPVAVEKGDAAVGDAE